LVLAKNKVTQCFCLSNSPSSLQGKIIKAEHLGKMEQVNQQCQSTDDNHNNNNNKLAPC